MFDGGGAAGAIEVDGDNVDPGIFGVDVFAEAVCEGARPDAPQLRRVDRFRRQAGHRAARAHFDKHGLGAIADHEVHFVAVDAQVAVEDDHARRFEAVGRDALAEIAEPAARGHHGNEAWATGA